METFILLMFDDEIWQEFSEEQQSFWIGKIREFAKIIDSRIIQADPLNSVGRVITKDKVEVVDFAGNPNASTGYFIFQATDFDEAVEVASNCPTLQFGGRIQLRRVGH
jgi:hypothetical protein